MKIIYFGGGHFAATVLKILSSAHDIIQVIAPSPKPTGRKMRPAPCPAHTMAENLRLPVAPNIAADAISKQSPAALIVCDYGTLLPKTHLNLTPLGALNIHPSLLPRWRGAAPIERAILAGDQETGVTIMRLNERLDAGELLACERAPITPQTTGGHLRDRLAEDGANCLLRVLAAPENHTPQAQDDAQASYAKKIRPQERNLDFSHSAQEEERRIRAFSPHPGAHCTLIGERIKIFRAAIVSRPPTAKAGEILAADGENGVIIACRKGALRLDELQRPGKRPMSSASLLRGFPLRNHLGDILTG